MSMSKASLPPYLRPPTPLSLTLVVHSVIKKPLRLQGQTTTTKKKQKNSNNNNNKKDKP